MVKAKFVVLAGGPGCGKTSLLEFLSQMGYDVIPEAATEIMRQSGIRDPSLLPNVDRKKFREAVVAFYLNRESEFDSSRIVFMDRSLIDTFAYAKFENRAIPDYIIQTMGELRERYYLVLEIAPLPVFHASEFRNVGVPEALALHATTIETYKEYGYTPLTIPPLSLQGRVQYVLKILSEQVDRGSICH